MPLPVVAIVGRPNVGKSTLFNRLVGRRVAIVADLPGTTRDRVIARATWEGRAFLLIDTGGLAPGTDDALWRKVQQQVEAALAEADVVILVTEATTGLHPEDQEVAQMLRRQEKPIVLAVNKCESEGRRLMASEFYALGLGDPIAISAVENTGIGELMEQVVALLPAGEEGPEEEVMKLAIVGRPNVGKSSILNAIVGEERAIVHEAPGTTRDALDTPVTYQGQRIILIDTAGIRRRGRVEPGVEKYSVLRAMQAIERCNVAVLVLDATEGKATAQDMHIAGYVLESYRGLVVAVNKWDLAHEVGLSGETLLERVRDRFRWARYVPVLLTSAVTGEGVRELVDTALQVYRERLKQLAPREVNRVLLEALAMHGTPSHHGRRLVISKSVQAGINPPTFMFYVNDANLVHFSYQRYLENALRRAFGFMGNPIRLTFKNVERVKGR